MALLSTRPTGYSFSSLMIGKDFKPATFKLERLCLRYLDRINFAGISFQIYRVLLSIKLLDTRHLKSLSSTIDLSQSLTSSVGFSASIVIHCCLNPSTTFERKKNVCLQRHLGKIYMAVKIAFPIQKNKGNIPLPHVAKRVKGFMTINTCNFFHFWQF